MQYMRKGVQTMLTLFITKYSSNKKPHECSECSARFIRKCHFLLHITTRRKKQRHACSRYGKVCNGNQGLLQHIRMHANRQHLKCNDCSRVQGYACIWYHNAISHRREAICLQPLWEMFSMQKLNEHARWDPQLRVKTHSYAWPFTCHECGMQFKRISPLQELRSIRLQAFSQAAPHGRATPRLWSVQREVLRSR